MKHWLSCLAAQSLHHREAEEAGRERGREGLREGGSGRVRVLAPGSSLSVLNCFARLTDLTGALAPQLRAPRSRSPAAKMRHRRPAQNPALLCSALWIFCHVSGARGALPTTRKLFFIYIFPELVRSDETFRPWAATESGYLRLRGWRLRAPGDG